MCMYVSIHIFTRLVQIVQIICILNLSLSLYIYIYIYIIWPVEKSPVSWMGLPKTLSRPCDTCWSTPCDTYWRMPCDPCDENATSGAVLRMWTDTSLRTPCQSRVKGPYNGNITSENVLQCGPFATSEILNSMPKLCDMAVKTSLWVTSHSMGTL